MKINTISPKDNQFLQRSQHIAKPVKKLYFLGQIPDKQHPTVAIVGSRKPTAYGREIAYTLAYELAQKGVIVVSGLALGVDSIAHRGALEAGGITLAVLANGLDYIYPRTHQGLAEQIVAQGGAIISEYEPHIEAYPSNFLERNRIVSGLSDAVIVVEAAARSGTLNTAAHALEQGRDIFAVPGNITSPLSAGCNALLKQGAMPVTTSDDVLGVIAPDTSPIPRQYALGDTEEEHIILQLLEKGIRDGELLQQKSTLSASTFSQTMTMLEIKGSVRALGANQWGLR